MTGSSTASGEATAADPQGTVTLPLPRALRMDALEGVREEALGALGSLDGSMSGLLVDGSAVDDVDAAGVQLLLATARAARARDLPFELRCSETLLSAIETLALDELGSTHA